MSEKENDVSQSENEIFNRPKFVVLWGIESDFWNRKWGAEVRAGRGCAMCGSPLGYPVVLHRGADWLWLHPECARTLASELLLCVQEADAGIDAAWRKEEAVREARGDWWNPFEGRFTRVTGQAWSERMAGIEPLPSETEIVKDAEDRDRPHWRAKP